MLYLKRLTYRNFLLFEHLDIEPENGLNIITGESGAGKSLFLEGIKLLSGSRLDGNLAAGLTNKAILEATYYVSNSPDIKEYLLLNDLDEEKELVIRREILANGKNRCFVNDTPVNLQILKDLGYLLSEVHSQHETSFIKSNAYQVNLVDSFAKTQNLKEEFKNVYLEIKNIQNKVFELENQQSNAIKEQDYLSFLLEELSQAVLSNLSEVEELELEQTLLSNATEIVGLTDSVSYAIEGTEHSIENYVSEIRSKLKSLSHISQVFEEEQNRFESSWLEMKEVAFDVKRKGNMITIDPQRLKEVEDRINLLQNLKRKHNVGSIEELIDIEKELAEKISGFASLENLIKEYNKQLATLEIQLNSVGEKLSTQRNQYSKDLAGNVVSLLSELEIPSAIFKIIIEKQPRKNWNTSGTDKISFIFSANPGIEPQVLESVASGGELSRLMLAFKAVTDLNNYLTVFDEIDSGVSGEVAMKVGALIQQMGLKSQMLVITHLPQVASKGNSHFVIRKESIQNKSGSNIWDLKGNDRVLEVARLLSGKIPGEKAIKNAEELLGLS